MSSGTTARQAASKSKPAGSASSSSPSGIVPSSAPSTSTIRSSETSPPRIAPWSCGRKARSVTATRLPAFENRYSICSGADVL
jgi:hypothetical protein